MTPEKRFELIDVNALISGQSDQFEAYPFASYASHHTTAGYLEQSLCRRLAHSPDQVGSYVQAFRALFPPEADYLHDELSQRSELTDEQKATEPRNADSHLTFIGSGLGSCVTYANQPDEPVYFVELDGVNGSAARTRRTTIVGYSRAVVEDRSSFAVPVSAHPMDSINLRDDGLGLFDFLIERSQALGIRKGRIDVALAPAERHAGLTVNEYETLLMRHDLMDVLRNPMRFMASKGYHMLRDPRAIPEKAKNYAKYDLVRIVNRLLDSSGLSESVVERVLDRFLSVPAARFLRMKRSVSLLVTDEGESTAPRVLMGTYQSPILVQWKKAEPGARSVICTFVRYE